MPLNARPLKINIPLKPDLRKKFRKFLKLINRLQKENHAKPHNP